MLRCFYSTTTFIRVFWSLLQIRQFAHLRSATCSMHGASRCECEFQGAQEPLGEPIKGRLAQARPEQAHLHTYAGISKIPQRREEEEDTCICVQVSPRSRRASIAYLRDPEWLKLGLSEHTVPVRSSWCRWSTPSGRKSVSQAHGLADRMPCRGILFSQRKCERRACASQLCV